MIVLNTSEKTHKPIKSICQSDQLLIIGKLSIHNKQKWSMTNFVHNDDSNYFIINETFKYNLLITIIIIFGCL